VGQTLGCIRFGVQVDIGDGLIDISDVVIALPALVLVVTVDMHEMVSWLHRMD
jgi:hypothetical protein